MPDAVKYLGVYLDPKSNNHQNISTRISRAMEASKKLSPLMKHGLLPPNWKLLVYRSVVQSILMYAMDSLLLTPAQLTKMDSIHYKCLRRIFKIKSSYYHRVINPSSSPCSNQYLAELAFSSRRVISPSQIYSQNRLNLLGHLYRHPDSLETQATFMPSAAYRHTRGANRVGRPKPHWAESCLVEASRRINFLRSDNPPPHSSLDHEFYAIPRAADIRQAHASHSLVWMDNTPLYRQVFGVARDRASWVPVVNKPSRKPPQRS